MDQHDPSRRQYAPGAYAAQQALQQQQQQQGHLQQVQTQQGVGQRSHSYATPTLQSQRFRAQAYTYDSPATTSARAGHDVQHAQQQQPMYGYAQTSPYTAVPALQPSAMQYTREMHAADVQRQQQQPQYSTYGANVMYNMAQPQSAQGQSTYDAGTQYRQRPSTASDTLASPFGVAQTSGHYYLPAGQAGSSAASAQELPALQSQQQQQQQQHHQQQQPPQPLPSQYHHQQSSYPQQALGPSAASPTYASAMLDSSQTSAYTYAPPQSAQPQPQYAPPPPPPPQQPSSSSSSLDQGFQEYGTRIRAIFARVRERNLVDVGPELLQVSQYIIGNAEALGLTRDDEALRDGRVALWDEFNRAWLTTLQCQFDMTEELALSRGRDRPDSLMSVSALEHLARELVRLCDSAERHGLVDYQMGVAEEEIMDLLLRCVSRLDPSSTSSADAPRTHVGAAAGPGGDDDSAGSPTPVPVGRSEGSSALGKRRR